MNERSIALIKWARQIMYYRNHKRTTILSTFCLCMTGLHLYAQDSLGVPINKDCQTKDVTEYLRLWFHMKPKDSQKESAFFIAPVVGSTPSTGFLVGLAVQGAFKLPSASLSSFQANVQYTAKKQF